MITLFSILSVIIFPHHSGVDYEGAKVAAQAG